MSVITSISLDHIGLIGNSLAEIAAAKAGIIKTGVPVITIKQNPEAAAIIIETCKRNNSELIIADTNNISGIRNNGRVQIFEYSGNKIELSSPAAYQRENAVIAFEAASLLGKIGYNIAIQQILPGLKKAEWRGRFSIISQEPTVIADGAHNPDGAFRLAESLKEAYPLHKKIFAVGIFKDKDYRGILRSIAPLAAQIIAVDMPENTRLMRADELAAAAREFCDTVYVSTSIDDAIRQALTGANKNGIIVICGSLSILSPLSSKLQALNSI